jgi:hypothetical protein
MDRFLFSLGKSAVQSGKRVVDIFSDSPGADEEENGGMLSSRNAMNPILAEVNDELIDDSEGYINIRIGDVLHSRYTVEEVKGKGVFSSVVRAKVRTGMEVFQNRYIIGEETNTISPGFFLIFAGQQLGGRCQGRCDQGYPFQGNHGQSRAQGS